MKINIKDIPLIKENIKKQFPFKIQSHNSLNYENTILLESVFKENVIPISVSKDSSFSGLMNSHNQLKMKIIEYLSYRGDLKLYLSQIELKQFVGLEDVIKLFDLKCLNGILNLEECQINIWHSFQYTLSKLHYDSYENLLFVISGQKTILLAPNDSKCVCSKFIGDDNNHGNLKENCEIYEINDNSMCNFDLKNKIFRIKVHSNQMLYIPEGWWHQVETHGTDNLAINIWWQNSVKNIKNNESFLLRLSFNSLIENKIVSIATKYKTSILNKIEESITNKILIKYLKSLKSVK